MAATVLAALLFSLSAVLYYVKTQGGTHVGVGFPSISLSQETRASSLSHSTRGPRGRVVRKLHALKVIKTYRDRTVYVLDEKNVRHVIPDWSTFLSLGYDISNIVTISDEEMNALALGDPLDPIVKEETPPNPLAGCPCVSQNDFLLSLKKEKEKEGKKDKKDNKDSLTSKGESKESVEEEEERKSESGGAVQRPPAITNADDDPDSEGDTATAASTEKNEKKEEDKDEEEDDEDRAEDSEEDEEDDDEDEGSQEENKEEENKGEKEQESEEESEEDDDDHRRMRKTRRTRSRTKRRTTKARRRAEVLIETELTKAEAHRICLVDSPNTNTFLSLFSSVADVNPNLLSFAKIPANFTQQGYRKLTYTTPALEKCDIVMEFTQKKDLYKYTCPELCFPVPYALVSLSWLENEAYLRKEAQDTPLTCSMTWRQLFAEGTSLHNLHHSTEANNALSKHHKGVSLILKAIARRRVEECFEREYWPTRSRPEGKKNTVEEKASSRRNPNPSQKTAPLFTRMNKRSVHGLIVWIGSRSRYDLLEDQIQVLKHTSGVAPSVESGSSAPAISEDLIAGWMASEDQYPCRVGSTICEEVTSSNAYYHYMPTTRMNVAASGWSCAQRRPLRAVAHTLLLYEMNYLLVVDDDTFVSVQILLSSPFKSFVKRELMTNPLVLGQLTHGRKVTRRGFYYGGAGYLIGKPVIERLNSFTLLGPATSMTAMVDPTMMRDLSLFNQIYPMSSTHCSECLAVAPTESSSPPLVDVKAQLKDPNAVSSFLGLSGTSKVRAVELCVNVMAQEHTCYHSDHSMTRCLVHGVYAAPLDIECGGTDLGDGLRFAMCMGTDNCDTEHVLTCHRYRASRADPMRPFAIYGGGNDSLADLAKPRKFTIPEESIYERRKLRGGV